MISGCLRKVYVDFHPNRAIYWCHLLVNFTPFISANLSLTLFTATIHVPLYGHIIHKNDPQTKPDLMLVFIDLQLHPDQRQSHQSLGAGTHHSKPQEAPYMTILYIKMILRPSSTWWWCFQTSNSTLINAIATNHHEQAANMHNPRKPPIWPHYT